jgi:hypothetical protein
VTTIEQELAERFKADTVAHTMCVLQDLGLYRHVRFRDPESFQYWFDLITSPGLLTIHGDMGTFVFARLTDMFAFFGDGQIQPQYWAEKLQAVDRCGYRQHSRRVFEQKVTEYVEDYTGDLDADDKAAVVVAVNEEVLATEYEGDARAALDAFEGPCGFNFHDTWEWDLTAYTAQYLWCCYAITWGIGQYRSVKS